MDTDRGTGGFFSWFRFDGNNLGNEDFSHQVVRDAIDMVVEIADPRIRQIRRYRRHMAPSVRDALEYCTDLVGSLRGPVRLSRSQYHADPLVKALFASPDELEEVLRLAFINAEEGDGKGREETFALLTMARQEKTIFTHGRNGDMVMRDMQKQTVNFVDHRVVTPSTDLEVLRTRLRTRALEVLATVAMEHIAELRGELAELREHKIRLKTMLTVLGGRNHTLELLAQPSRETARKIQAVKEELHQVDSSIAEVRKKVELPQDSLLLLQQCLERVGELLTSGEQRLRLNWMNVRVEADPDEEGNDIELTELALKDELRRSAVLVTFNRPDTGST